MATTVASPRRSLPALTVQVSPTVRAGALLVVLVAGAFALHLLGLGTSFWMDEGLSVGIASHPLLGIPGVLIQDGSPPLYYMLLHVWMGAFGHTETSTHVLSTVFSFLTVPVGLWAGWSLFSRRVGFAAAALCAFNPFLATYGHETRMYSLLALLGLLAVAFFLHAFVYGRRRYVPALAVVLAAMLYTHNWGIFFGVGMAAALVPVLRSGGDRRRILIDAALAFGGAGLLYLPWLPTLLYQAQHTGAPWVKAPRLGAPIQIARGLLGGDRTTVALVLAGGAGAAIVLRRALSRERRSVLVMLVLTITTLVVAWIVSQVSPAWTTRYLAVVLGPILLLAALGLMRAGRLGLVSLGLVLVLWAPPAIYMTKYKSNVSDVAAEMRTRLKPGDLVIVMQPEQTPLVHYYLPPGLRYASELSPVPVRDPRVMDWRDAMAKMRAARPEANLAPLLATLAPGQHVLFVPSITENAQNWQAPWTSFVRRRAAQWGEALANDRQLVRTATAPSYYRSVATIGVRAVLYTKTGP